MVGSGGKVEERNVAGIAVSPLGVQATPAAAIREVRMDMEVAPVEAGRGIGENPGRIGKDECGHTAIWRRFHGSDDPDNPGFSRGESLDLTDGRRGIKGIAGGKAGHVRHGFELEGMGEAGGWKAVPLDDADAGGKRLVRLEDGRDNDLNAVAGQKGDGPCFFQ